MSTNDTTQQAGAFSRPLQRIPWAEKTEAWYKRNIEFYIGQGVPLSQTTTPQNEQDLSVLYNAYNNQFPMDWFKHVTNPLSAKKAAHKSFPARIRPVSILRKNIDLLLGEFPRRPMVYNVENMGDEGYNSYEDKMMKTAVQSLTDHFMQSYLQELQQSGQQLSPEQMDQLQKDPPLPEEIKEEFNSTYKDAVAIKAQKWLNRTIRDKEVKNMFLKLFKDYLIAGQAYSYKAIENGQLVYRRVSGFNIAYDKSADQDFIEDGAWVRAVYYLTISEVVDMFYMDLKPKDIDDLESKSYLATPEAFTTWIRTNTTTNDFGKIPVYHVQWKGFKEQQRVMYIDEMGQLQEEWMDENYTLAEGEKSEKLWTDEVYEGWRIGPDMYVRMQAAPVQRNEAINKSTCKLNYNGRKYSDTHSRNISVLEMGLPFQIMYIITNYILEKTIAKSKGKILLIDKNAVPDKEGWDEEKFFYYGEALGYFMIDRDQAGVDKSWNQYQVLDMSLFDQIKQLIELMDSFKNQWDDLIGVTRQRQGQTYASDGQGVNERAVFQSTVITDMIFIGFEQFMQRELQGFLDYAKYLTADGEKSMVTGSDFMTTLFEILPQDFTMANLGIFLDSSSEHIRRMNDMRNYALSMVQAGHKASTVLEVVATDNSVELMNKLKQIEAIDAQLEQSNTQNEQEHEKAIEQQKQMFAEFASLLQRDNMEAEYDRKEELKTLEITLSAELAPKAPLAPSEETANVVDANVLMTMVDEHNKHNDQMQLKRQQLADKKASDKADRIVKMKELQHKMTMDNANLAHNKEKQKIDRKKVTIAARKKTAS